MPKKILIADDEPAILSLLKTRLIAIGYDVITTSDGADALAKVRAEKPDLIIADILMPGLTGYQFYQRIRAAEGAISNIPIIIISAKHKMRDLFNDANISAFIFKPFDIKELITKIEEILPKAVPPLPKPPPAPQVNTIVIAGTEEFVLLKIADHLKPLGYNIILERDDQAVIKTVADARPSYFFCQFWENPSQFDSEKIYNELQSNLHVQLIPFVFFSTNSLGMDAVKVVKSQNLLVYNETSDLIKKIDAYLNIKS